MSRFEWTEDASQRLRELWADGHSTTEIGRRLGMSKNAIVGKKQRLDLPARPSPIRTRDPALPSVRRPTPRPTGQTLPPLASTQPLAPGGARRAPSRSSSPDGRAACCAPLGPLLLANERRAALDLLRQAGRDGRAQLLRRAPSSWDHPRSATGGRAVSFVLAELRCACGSAELVAVAPGDGGERVDLLDITTRRPEPIRCWCAACWPCRPLEMVA